MDYKKVFLYIATGMVAMSLWQQWHVDYPAATASTPAASTSTQAQTAPGVTSTTATAVGANLPVAVPSERIIHIKTEVLDLSVDRLGGSIVSAKLLDYPESLHAKDKPYVLLNDEPEKLNIAQSGLVTVGGMPNEIIDYTSKNTSYQLKSGEGSLVVELSGRNLQGVSVTKTFTLTPGSYLIKVNYELSNKTPVAWSGQVYSQFTHKELPSNSSYFGISSYRGASISDPENKPYQKLTYAELEKQNLDKTVKGGWTAMQEHYFVSAWVPDVSQSNHYYSYVLSPTVYTIGMTGPVISLAPNESKAVSLQFYTGPEITDQLKLIAPALDYTIDFGKLAMISSPLFWLLKQIYSFIGNWGLAIIGLTILIKACFITLSNKSFRSMANMRRLQPKIEALKQRYADDKQGFSRATMDLYKQEKVNPFSGCWPMLVQIPFFISLYWVLLESVELRHAPFFGWIQDLSAPDPYYVLPILMGISMLLQQKLNPPPPDPMQAKMMMLLPVVFTALFINFPSGLVLYWTINNVFTITHQWLMMRKLTQVPKRVYT
jgi:YidC/Oxa1 family membrane protein insertase